MIHKKKRRKPDIIFYSILEDNEINSLTATKTLYNIEVTLVDNLVTNNKIGTKMVVGTLSNATSTNNLLFYSETSTMCFPKGTITAISSGVNINQPNGVFIQTKAPIFGRICTGSGIYTFKKGFVVTKTIDTTKRKTCIYFTN